MKIGIIGDGHITDKAPKRRLDDYFQTALGKFQEALRLTADCDLVVQVGDMFDSPYVSNRVICEVAKLLMTGAPEERNPIYCVAGQHDIFGHAMHTYPNSPMSVLETFDLIRLLTYKPSFKIGNHHGAVWLYGSSFGEETPQVTTPGEYNVLVTHRMIGEYPLYPGHDITGPHVFLRNNPQYDLVICGDYHYRFICEYEGRWIINAGCLIRKTIDVKDLALRPAVVIFDTETKESEVLEVTFQPPEKVFDMTREVQTEDNKVLELVEAMKARKSKVAGWKGFVPKVLEQMGCRKEVGTMLDGFIGNEG